MDYPWIEKLKGKRNSTTEFHFSLSSEGLKILETSTFAIS